jgi:adenylosuccinate synthase
VSGKVSVVVGGQFGSEAKGAVAAFLSTEDPDQTVIGVRVGGPNAGHTVYGDCPPSCDGGGGHADGEHPWRLRQVPVLAVSRTDAKLYIASGSEVDIDVLHRELDELDSAGYEVTARLIVDYQATVLEQAHIDAENGGTENLNQRIGSTAKGIGAARADRIWRRASLVQDLDPDTVFFHGGHAVSMLLMALADGAHVIIEGTQGYGLGLHSGFYPNATSTDCRAIDFLAQTGISPWCELIDQFDVWVVVRTLPIRVAGNSGPLIGETTWEDLSLPIEMTTVTGRIRRVGVWDSALVRAALQANGAPSPNVHLALTMVDHVIPETAETVWDQRTWDALAQFLTEIEEQLTHKVEIIGTGPISMSRYSRRSGVPIVTQFAHIRRNRHLSSGFDPEVLGGMLRVEGVTETLPGYFEPKDLPIATGDELTDWWLEQARKEAKIMQPKAFDYGGRGAAVDLIDIGNDLARLMGRKDVSVKEATELGIYFYIKGKFGRWTAALLEGRRVSDDTLHDISVYCRMAQRTRDVGGWPYPYEETTP